jgi:hypothetical protein
MLLGLLMMQVHPADQKHIDTLNFWIGTLPELVGSSLRNPPRHGNFGNHSPAFISPLPDVIQENTKGWRAQFQKAFKYRPVVIRKLVQQEPSRFADLIKLSDSEGLHKLFSGTKVPVFTHMTQDRSAVYMDFVKYMEASKGMSNATVNDSRLLYARAMHDSSGTLEASIDEAWIAKLVGLEWGLTLTEFLMPQRGHKLHIFPGSKPTWTQCHCDITTSIFIMVEGRKRWRFYAPDQTSYLYPYGQQLNSAFNTAVDVHHPDVGIFPEFAKAVGYEVTLEPGDVLFFPSMWWHAVENLDSMSIGLDLSIIDMVGALWRNPLLSMVSLGNPKLVMATVQGWVNGRGLMAAFFESYLVHPEI